ncbi:MAG: hypothetical protein CL920_00980 [Deltaproteobacteria bacterium]|nr:hypothetical protein [Deltaproteobacteria bacterium]
MEKIEKIIAELENEPTEETLYRILLEGDISDRILLYFISDCIECSATLRVDDAKKSKYTIGSTSPCAEEYIEFEIYLDRVRTWAEGCLSLQELESLADEMRLTKKERGSVPLVAVENASEVIVTLSGYARPKAPKWLCEHLVWWLRLSLLTDRLWLAYTDECPLPTHRDFLCDELLERDPLDVDF